MSKIVLTTDINIEPLDDDGDDSWERDAQRAERSFELLPDFFSRVAGERCGQDHQHGGPAHDDNLDPSDWEDILDLHVSRLTLCQDGIGFSTSPDYLDRLVKIAALAAAAWQSHRRITANEEE